MVGVEVEVEGGGGLKLNHFFHTLNLLGYNGLMHINLVVEGSALHTVTFSLFFNEQLQARFLFLFSPERCCHATHRLIN